eukprot:m.478482 g.478482  ORF g.478482 m.478482 type:complete len:70 (+) comp21151_c0_seq1:249-458(+)
MSSWRAAGLTYVQFSAIAAKHVRNALRADFTKAATKRAEATLTVRSWEAAEPITNPKTFEEVVTASLKA